MTGRKALGSAVGPQELRFETDRGLDPSRNVTFPGRDRELKRTTEHKYVVSTITT